MLPKRERTCEVFNFKRHSAFSLPMFSVPSVSSSLSQPFFVICKTLAHWQLKGPLQPPKRGHIRISDLEIDLRWETTPQLGWKHQRGLIPVCQFLGDTDFCDFSLLVLLLAKLSIFLYDRFVPRLDGISRWASFGPKIPHFGGDRRRHITRQLLSAQLHAAALKHAYAKPIWADFSGRHPRNRSDGPMQTNPRLPRSPWLIRTANRLLAPGDVLRKLLFLTLQDRLDMCGGQCTSRSFHQTLTATRAIRHGYHSQAGPSLGSNMIGGPSSRLTPHFSPLQ